MEAFQTILKVYIAATLIPLSIYFITKKYQHPSMAYLATMLIFSFLVDGFGLTSSLWFHFGKPLNIVYNSCGFLEIATVVMLYQLQLSPGKKMPFLLIAASVMTIQIAEMFIFRGIDVFPATTRAVFAIVVTALALRYFFKLVRDLPRLHIYHITMFWVNIGMLVYFTGNFFLFVTQPYLVNVLKDNLVFHWSLHNLLGILSYVFFSIGLWQARRKATSQ